MSPSRICGSSRRQKLLTRPPLVLRAIVTHAVPAPRRQVSSMVLGTVTVLVLVRAV